MGYTHYWTWPDGPAYRQAWPGLLHDAAAIVTAVTRAGIHLAGPIGTGTPYIQHTGIRLNGDLARGEAYEAFIIWPPSPDGATTQAAHGQTVDQAPGQPTGPARRWDFCKTARMPYDLAVCAILLRFHLVLPEHFVIASDGSWDTEWNRPPPATTTTSQPGGIAEFGGISPRQLVTGLFGPVPEASPLSRISWD
jgi:hypothetical protein